MQGERTRMRDSSGVVQYFSKDYIYGHVGVGVDAVCTNNGGLGIAIVRKRGIPSGEPIAPRRVLCFRRRAVR